MKKLLPILLCLLCLTVVFAEASSLSEFAWTLEEGKVVLTKYNGTSASVTIPDTFSVDGTAYPVSLDAATVFRDNTTLRTVTINPKVTFRDNTMARLFAGCGNLEQVTALGLDTARVTSMRGMFNGCKKLRLIEGYENWNTESLESIAFLFNEVQSLKTIDLSRWDLSNLKNSGWCFQYCHAETILLPDNLAIIGAGFLNHATEYAGSSFTVPAGVETVGYAHTLYDFATNDLTEILVAEGNTHYKSVDGILLSADGREFLAVPRNKTFPEGVYAIPEGVTFLGELSFSRNHNLQTLILPDSLELYYVPRKDPAYTTFEDTGNLNAGLNLNIAIYCYTGITAYEVKDTNPRYASEEGVIYSKDMTALVAVPSRYDRFLDIPEGVTRWEFHAMWNAGDFVDGLMVNCPGVSIPASLTDIAPEQLEKLNRLAHRYDFTIRLAEGNPAYFLQDGSLLARPRIADAEISLEQDAFVYDGSPQTPAVTVTLNGQTLTEGADYALSFENNRNAGTATVRVTGLGDKFGAQDVSFTIGQAEPTYTLPKDLTAVYGQSLSEIPLPENFSWETDSAVGNVGENRFFLSYASPDPNYRSLSGLPVTVTVTPKTVTPDFETVKALYAFTGKPIEPGVDLPGVPAEEYAVSYEQNLWFGTATIRVTDTPGGNYTVTGQTTFRILPSPWLLALPTALLTLPLLRKRKR